MTILAIVGTREFVNPHWAHLAGAIIDGALSHWRPTSVVSGGAPGVDTLAAGLAAHRGYTVGVRQPTAQQWEGPGGYRERNAAIALECDVLLAIRCSEATSYGSGWTADEAERLGREVHRRIIAPDDTVDVNGWCWCGLAADDPLHGAWHKLKAWNRGVTEAAAKAAERDFDRRLADREQSARARAKAGR